MCISLKLNDFLVKSIILTNDVKIQSSGTNTAAVVAAPDGQIAVARPPLANRPAVRTQQ